MIIAVIGSTVNMVVGIFILNTEGFNAVDGWGFLFFGAIIAFAYRLNRIHKDIKKLLDNSK